MVGGGWRLVAVGGWWLVVPGGVYASQPRAPHGHAPCLTIPPPTPAQCGDSQEQTPPKPRSVHVYFNHPVHFKTLDPESNLDISLTMGDHELAQFSLKLASLPRGVFQEVLMPPITTNSATGERMLDAKSSCMLRLLVKANNIGVDARAASPQPLTADPATGHITSPWLQVQQLQVAPLLLPASGNTDQSPSEYGLWDFYAMGHGGRLSGGPGIPPPPLSDPQADAHGLCNGHSTVM